MGEFQTAFYLGKEKETGYGGVVVEENLFLTAELPEGVSSIKGREFVRELKSRFISNAPRTVHELDDLVSSCLKDQNLALGVSLALGYIKGKILYLKTIGTGQVIIRRKNKTALLISGNTSASGYYDIDDVYAFTTSGFVDCVGGIDLLSGYLSGSPSVAVEQLSLDLQDKETEGKALTIVRFTGSPDIYVGKTTSYSSNWLLKAKESIDGYYQKYGKKKTLTFIAVGLIFAVFFWSVVLGYSRRTSKKAKEEIKLAQSLVREKIIEAEDVSFLNNARARMIISEIKSIYKDLTIKYPDDEEVRKIGETIKEAENKILKKEEAVTAEFYDLGVDSSEASGSICYLDSEKMLILDNKRGMLYEVSLDNKSFGKETAAELKKATLIALNKGGKYFFIPGEGIFTVSQNRSKRIIENDKDWGEIIDMAFYNSNMYLLDRKGQIYKYPSVESGFGSKTFYFAAGQEIDLSSYRSFAIDGSIYISGKKSIVKFTSGLRDGFSVDIPEEDYVFGKIFVSRDLDNVYVKDVQNLSILVLGKEGEMVKEIKLGNILKNSDFAVYENVIYLLSGRKIYSVK